MNIAHSNVHADDPAAGQRINRNLSDVISTIRDDGPSADAGEPAGVFQLHLAEARGPNAQVNDPVDEGHAGPRGERRRVLPRAGVIFRALAMFLLLVAGAGMALLAGGRVPMLDEHGMYLADLPDGLVDDLASIKLSIGDAYEQLYARIAPAIDALTATPDAVAEQQAEQQAATSGMDRQRALLERLDRLEQQVLRLQVQPVPLETLQHRQNGLAHRLEIMQAQLDGLAQRPATVAAKPAATGDWVVNLAASGNEGRLRALQRKLQAAGIDTEVTRLEQDGSTRFRLQAVGYASSGAARRAAGELSEVHDLPGAWAARRDR